MTAVTSRLLIQRLPNIWIHYELKIFLTDNHAVLPSYYPTIQTITEGITAATQIL